MRGTVMGNVNELILGIEGLRPGSCVLRVLELIMGMDDLTVGRRRALAVIFLTAYDALLEPDEEPLGEVI